MRGSIRAERRARYRRGGVLTARQRPLREFAERTGIAVCETQAGKSALPWDHPLAAGAIGATGGIAANQLAREADLVLAVGTRLSDFTTMSKTAFANPNVRFVAINVCELDAFKHSAIPIVADARIALEELGAALADYSTSPQYRNGIAARAGPGARDHR